MPTRRVVKGGEFAGRRVNPFEHPAIVLVTRRAHLLLMLVLLHRRSTAATSPACRRCAGASVVNVCARPAFFDFLGIEKRTAFFCPTVGRGKCCKSVLRTSKCEPTGPNCVGSQALRCRTFESLKMDNKMGEMIKKCLISQTQKANAARGGGDIRYTHAKCFP